MNHAGGGVARVREMVNDAFRYRVFAAFCATDADRYAARCIAAV